jgi:hypothetical protein
MHQEQFELLVLESGPPAEIELSWLQGRHPDAPGERPERSRRGRRRRGGRGRDGLGDSNAAVDPGDSGDEADLLGDEIEEAIDALDESIEEDGVGSLEAGREPVEDRDAGDGSAVRPGIEPGSVPELAASPPVEGGEVLQPVDGEVESRIIPRSE